MNAWSIIRRVGKKGIVWIVGALCCVSWCCYGSSQQPDSLLEVLLSLRESLDLSLYLAKAAVLALDPEDMRINLKEIASRITEESVPDESTSMSIIELADRGAALLLQEPLDPTLKLNLTSALNSASEYIALAIDATTVGESADTPSLRAAARRTYAYLLAALGSDNPGAGLAGIVQMIASLPGSTIQVSPGDDLQEAVDRVLSGGTIQLAPGTYTLDSQLVISKSMTFAGQPTATKAVELIGQSAQPVLSVDARGSDHQIRVSIVDIHVLDGSYGVSVDCDYHSNTLTLVLSDLDIADCVECGIFVVRGRVILNRCTIRQNGEYGILITSDAQVSVQDCVVRDNGTPALADVPYRLISGIHATGAGELTIRRSTIEGNAGSGVHVERHVVLTLEDSLVSDNGQDGLLAWDGSVLQVARTQFLENGGFGIGLGGASCGEIESSSLHQFTGTVTGEGNLVPGPEAVLGNLAGSTCPEDAYYDFVSDPEG